MFELWLEIALRFSESVVVQQVIEEVQHEMYEDRNYPSLARSMNLSSLAFARDGSSSNALIIVAAAGQERSKKFRRTGLRE